MKILGWALVVVLVISAAAMLISWFDPRLLVVMACAIDSNNCL